MLLIAGSRKAVLAYVAAAGFAALAVAVLFQQTFDYMRDDGAVQKVSTGTNVASALFARRVLGAGSVQVDAAAASHSPVAATLAE